MTAVLSISGKFERISSTQATPEGQPEPRIIAGLASVPSVVDSYGTIFTAEALEEALKDFMTAPVLRFQHETPIGRVLAEYETQSGEVLKTAVRSDGLFVVAEIATGTQAADEAWALIKQEVINGFSIGGQIERESDIKWENIDGEDVGVITHFRLVEISVVDLPANSAARFKAVRLADISESRGDKITEERQGATAPEEPATQAPEAAPDTATPDLTARVETLEGEVAALEGALGELRAMVEALASNQSPEEPASDNSDQVQNAEEVKVEPEPRRGMAVATITAVEPKDLRQIDRKDLLKVLEEAGRF